MQARRKQKTFVFDENGVAGTGSTASLLVMLKQARKSGQLNLSNRAMTEVPLCVWRINLDTPEEGQTISMDGADDRWWEQIDLTKLILASNVIERLSDDIRLLPALSVLDIHDNRLTSLPNAIGDLKNLLRLNASHNSLVSLPASLFQLTLLQSLHLENNRLESLPNSLGDLARLEDLDLSNNSLSSLPITIAHLISLTKLNVASNCLQTLPHEIGFLRSLKTLDATHNQIHTLPDDIGNLRHLECLYLRHNKLTLLPNLENCIALKELQAGNNSLRAISPDVLRNLPQLSLLDLRDNRLEQLPDEVGLLQALERLDLTNNTLSNLPVVLGSLPQLKAIVLDGNPLKSIRRDIVMRGTMELKKYLRSRMEPETVEQSALPATVFQEKVGTSGIVGGEGDSIDKHKMMSTKTLDYCDKKASVIPDELLEAAVAGSVNTVILSRNQLTALPPRLVDLNRSLSELTLSFNRLSVIDSSIGCLEKLVMLDLSNNQLSNLPEELGSLSKMRELVISFNRFTRLPTAVYQLKRLEILMVNDNQMSELDAPSLCQLPMLAVLALQNNNISNVPPELGNCIQLRNLQLEGNPFRQPRAAILAKGTVGILDYLRDRIPRT